MSEKAKFRFVDATHFCIRAGVEQGKADEVLRRTRAQGLIHLFAQEPSTPRGLAYTCVRGIDGAQC